MFSHIGQLSKALWSYLLIQIALGLVRVIWPLPTLPQSGPVAQLTSRQYALSNSNHIFACYSCTDEINVKAYRKSANVNCVKEGKFWPTASLGKPLLREDQRKMYHYRRISIPARSSCTSHWARLWLWCPRSRSKVSQTSQMTECKLWRVTFRHFKPNDLSTFLDVILKPSTVHTQSV